MEGIVTKAFERIYLDYNATTPLDEEVVDVISKALRDGWGNPSSPYAAGTTSKELMSQAREEMAVAINAKASDIIFTSGGTESNNWVIDTAVKHFDKSAIKKKEKELPHIVSTTVEHDSISLPLQALAKEGKIEVTFVPINEKAGTITPEDIASAIKHNTCLVTVMMANNETGTIMPIKEISKAVRSAVNKYRPFLHTDAAQALGKILVDAQDLGVDFMTIVGHKFYGPRIGALYVRGLEKNETPLYPMFFGGGQERNYRPGTENTPMIVGLGRAALISHKRLQEFAMKMEETRNHLESRLSDEFGDKVIFNCRSLPRLPNTSSASFLGKNLEGYKLLQRIQGFCCSTGSACHSDTCEPSRVLLNFHVPFHQAANTIRISTGRSTSVEDIDRVVEELKSVLADIQTG